MCYIMQVLLVLLIADLASPNACRSQETSETAPQDCESWTFGAVEAARRQEEAADEFDVPVEYENRIGMKLRLIPAGDFMMGSSADEKYREGNEEPVHRVEIRRPFYLGTREVRQGEWLEVMDTAPWRKRPNTREGTDYPATYISWKDAQAFCEQLSRLEVRVYRLPTEAEWEYACRAGSRAAYGFGNEPSMLKEYAWFKINTCDCDECYPHETGRKTPNNFGLYDMHGNVWEWCEDRYSFYYALTPSADPTGPKVGDSRVHRGGGFRSLARYCRSADRARCAPSVSQFDLGFRVVCSEEQRPGAVDRK